MSDLSFDDKIDACKEFLNNFGRVPKYREITMINGKLFRIGQFVHCAKKGYYNSEVKNKLIDIFGVKQMNIKRGPRTPMQCKIDACKEFQKLFKRCPKNDEMFVLSDGEPFNIGFFVHNARYSTNEDLKNKITDIFNIKSKWNNELVLDDKLEACKMFNSIYHRFPNYNEEIRIKGIEFRIGLFIQCVEHNYYTPEIKQIIHNIFGMEQVNY